MTPRYAILAVMVAAALIATACSAAPEDAQDETTGPRVLIFSHSTGYRHDSIEPGVAALEALAVREGYGTVSTEDPDIFSADQLAGIDAIVLLSASTDGGDPDSEWFTGARRAALQDFVRSGGGVVGIHAAADSHYHWPWYGQMIGARFEHHPPGTPEGALTVVDADHPATRGLPPDFTREDEWYYYAGFNEDVRLLLTFDPASIGEPSGPPRPIAWAHEFEGGRVFYTGMGHTPESYAEPLFLDHLRGGLAWVLELEN